MNWFGPSRDSIILVLYRRSIRRPGTSTYYSRDRALIAFAWELAPADFTGPFQIQLDAQNAIAVLDLKLEGYFGIAAPVKSHGRFYSLE